MGKHKRSQDSDVAHAPRFDTVRMSGRFPVRQAAVHKGLRRHGCAGQAHPDHKADSTHDPPSSDGQAAWTGAFSVCDVCKRLCCGALALLASYPRKAPPSNNREKARTPRRAFRSGNFRQHRACRPRLEYGVTACHWPLLQACCTQGVPQHP